MKDRRSFLKLFGLSSAAIATRVGLWWRVYLSTAVCRAMGGIFIIWTDIGAGDTWQEALMIAREHLETGRVSELKN
jgi:hypothetical protein